MTLRIEYRVQSKTGDWLWFVSRGKAVALDAEGNVERVMGTNTDIGFSSLFGNGMVGPLTEEQTLQIGMVHEAGEHLLELVNDILDLSKVEAGAIEVHLGPVDLIKLVTGVAATLRPLAAEKDLELRVETPDQEMVIETDKNKLRQILLNIVGNAVKFTTAGEVCISFKRDDDGQVAFIISDTGPGIPAGEIERVFDAFHQAERAGGALTGGTGLGLAISRDLAHLLGGEITVTSVEGEGSVFTLWLPAA